MKSLAKHWATHFLLLEPLLAVIITTMFWGWSEGLGGRAHVDEALDGNRAAVYGAMASLFGALLGFVITAVSILLGFSASDKLTVVRDSDHYTTLWAVFTLATKILGFATVAALTGLILDREKHHMHELFYVMAGFSVLALLAVARCLWVLEQVVGLVTGPSKARPGGQ